MKNTKAIFLIVLGSFIMATGFAFAAESETFNKLMNNNPFNDGRSASVLPASKAVLDVSGQTNVPAASAPAAAVTAPAAPAPAAAAPAVAPAEKKPTVGETIKSFLGEHKKDILLGGIGAYLGWALVGTLAGALTGGIFFLAFFMLAGM